MVDKQQLRRIFDEDALLYDAARPGYPTELFDDIVAFAQFPSGGRILEIGCGTGQATRPLAERGYAIQAVELGANLAAVARDKLSAYPQVRIHVGSFEDWPLEPAAFDVAISAMAFHWINPAIGYPKLAQALRKGGSIALFWHVHVQSQASRGFFEAVDDVYRSHAPQLARDNPLTWPDDVQPTVQKEIEQTGLFGPVTVRRYCWDISYDAASYIQLLNTYSDRRSLEPETRARLFAGISDLIDTRYQGQITKGYMAMLYLAHRLP